MANGAVVGGAWRSIVVGVAGAVLGAAVVSAPGLIWQGGSSLTQLQVQQDSYGDRLDRIETTLKSTDVPRAERLARLEAQLEEVRSAVIRIERRLDSLVGYPTPGR